MNNLPIAIALLPLTLIGVVLVKMMLAKKPQPVKLKVVSKPKRRNKRK